MLCIMHAADHYGFLMVADIPLTDAAQLARLLKDTEKELAPLLAELEGAGVFSRVGSPNVPAQIAALVPVGIPVGTILSRKMLRDKAASDVGRKNGAKGGNPALSGHADEEGITRGLTLGITQRLSQGVKTQKTEDRSTLLRKDADASVGKYLNGKTSPSKPFDDKGWLFRDGLEWLAKATGRPQTALRSQLGRWLKDAKEDSTALRSAFVAAQDQGVVEPIAWITAAIRGRGNAAQPFECTDAHGWRKRCQIFKDSGVWPPQWGGTKPGDDERHPASLLSEFGYSSARQNARTAGQQQ
jgi:hypothetical protein